jgi:hypothetical protein
MKFLRGSRPGEMRSSLLLLLAAAAAAEVAS